jgi:molybdate transport system substrate-binding protein
MTRFAFALMLGAANVACAAEATVAVAANFAAPAKVLAQRFAAQTGHKLVLSSGSTGKFYAQIRSGAPFEVLLSADAATPQRLEEEKLAVAGSAFTYAVGKLVLWSAKLPVDENTLRAGRFTRLAIANPKLAPYGAAAQEALVKLGLWPGLQPRLVVGENIAQAFQFVASGNADLGFIAFSQISEGGSSRGGSYWPVPASLHAPIRQDAALLTRGSSNAAAREFLAFLRSEPARELIAGYGYHMP